MAPQTPPVDKSPTVDNSLIAAARTLAVGFDRRDPGRACMTGQDDLQGRIRVPADLDAVTAVGDEDPLRDRPGGRRTDLAGRPPLVCGGDASGDPAVPATQRQGCAQPGDRARLGQCPHRPAGRREDTGQNRYAVLCLLVSQGDHRDRRAHARRTRAFLTRRSGLRLPAPPTPATARTAPPSGT